MSGILWIIFVGFVAGIIARLLSPGPKNPTGFILTTVLGIAGAFLATFVGQADRSLRAGSGRGLHHLYTWRAGGPVHLAQTCGQPRDFRSRCQIVVGSVPRPSRSATHGAPGSSYHPRTKGS